MPPAAKHGHRHRHQKVQKATHVERQGICDGPSICNNAPSVSPALCLSFNIGPSLSPPSTLRPIYPFFATTPAVPAPAQTATTAATLQEISIYPRLSPPRFLYPEPIVPRQAYTHSMRQKDEGHGARPLHRSFAYRQLDAASTLSTPMIAALVFVVIAVAAAWSVVVMLIHWRRATTEMNPVRQRSQNNEGVSVKRGWCARMLGRWSSWATERRYEALYDGGNEMDEVDQLHALSSAHDLGAGLASPENPYLVFTDQCVRACVRRVKPRASAEWAEQHRAFFSTSLTRSQSPSQSPVLPSRFSSSAHSLSCAELESVEYEAREAQGQRVSLAGDEGRVNRSWVDVGLAAVDGAVDRFSGKIVRWTDDGDRDEALLLPLAKGKHD